MGRWRTRCYGSQSSSARQAQLCAEDLGTQIASIASGKAYACHEVVRKIVKADTSPDIRCNIWCDEIDQSSHGVMPRSGRSEPATRIGCVPLGEQLKLLSDL